MTSILKIKSSVFGIDYPDERIFSNFGEIKNKEYLEEILDSLLNKEKNNEFVVFDGIEKKFKKNNLDNKLLWIDEEKFKKKPNLILYEFENDIYYVYVKRKENIIYSNRDISPKIPKDPELENNYGLFAPSGVIVRRVSQNILGTGVLGRAFLGMNYIEILDSLVGNAYQEVLTHEVLHIIYPEKKEMDIRNMTRNYIGPKNSVYH